MNLALTATDPNVSIEEFYRAWCERIERNTVARMRFAGLRFVVKLRRGAQIRRTMGYDEVRV